MKREPTSSAARSQQPQRLPRSPIGLLLRELRVWHAEVQRARQGYVGWGTDADGLPRYPIDMEPFLALPHGILDAQGVPLNTIHNVPGGVHQPTTIAQYGLGNWNAYLRTREPKYRDAFLVQAEWLIEHAQLLTNGTSVWPLPVPQPSYGATRPWLSALTQGNVISVLVRAHQITGDEVYLESARRAARSYALDILDGGVNAPVGKDGIFFEEVATYPVARILNGYLLALIGLYDFVRLTGDDEIRALAERSVATLHALIDEYDMGYWSRYDILHCRPAPRSYHALHISLLQALADYTGCEHCRALAAKWAAYERSRWCRLRYYVASRRLRYAAAFAARSKPWRQHGAAVERPWRVAVPLSPAPSNSGDSALAASVTRAMAGEWQIEYLTPRAEPPAEGVAIHTFGSRWRWLSHAISTPANFPNMFFYVMAGKQALARLLRQRRFDLVLPQDGTFTAAYSASAARKAGVPLVFMDRGTTTLPGSAEYRLRHLRESAAKPLSQGLIARLRIALYRASLWPLIRRRMRTAERFLIAEDEVEKAYQEQLGVPLSRIVRYPYLVQAEQPAPAASRSAARTSARDALGLDPSAIVVTLLNRMTPEQGLDCALAAIAEARRLVTAEVASALRVLVVGDGPLVAMLRTDIRQRGLEDVCTLWGEATADDVAVLLRASDIFLHTGRRGNGDAMAVLEAMAAGCAVVATTSPASNQRLLAGGRGFAVAGDDVGAIASALAALLDDAELRSRMGTRAQQHVAAEHSVEALRRAMRRATGWAPVLESLTSSAARHAAPDGGHSGETAVSVRHEEQ